MGDENKVKVSDERLAQVFDNMLEVISSYPMLLEEGVLAEGGLQGISFYAAHTSHDESARIGIEVIDGTPSFYFGGGWFGGDIHYEKPITDSKIAVKELNRLCNYMFTNYEPHQAFLEELVNNFQRSLQGSLGRVLAKQKIPGIRERLYKKG